MKSKRDTLLHFTGLDGKRRKLKKPEDAFQTLCSIIKDSGFNLAENERALIFAPAPKKSSIEGIRVRMACFTDTPFDFIAEHMQTFGKFGIAMYTSWAVKKGAMTVIYYDNSQPNILGETLEEIYGKFFVPNPPAMQTEFKWDHTIAGITEDIRFRREREWRLLRKNFKTDQREQVRFKKSDIAYFVVPKNYSTKLRDFLLTQPAFRVNPPAIKTV